MKNALDILRERGFVKQVTFEDDLYAIGFRKDDLALRDKVNEILNEMAADGTLAKISETWFGSDISLVGKEAE